MFGSRVDFVLPKSAAAESGAGFGRLAWVDYAKAFAIILVVFGHASRSVDRTDGLTWSDGLRVADQLIYSFHISLFFILAGTTATLVAGRSLLSQARGLWWGLVLPYLIWTVVWVGLKMAFPGSANTPAEWSELVTALWLPVEHMWFLQHLFIARVFWLLATRMDARASQLPVGSAVIAGLFILSSWTGLVEPEPRQISAIMCSVAFVGVGMVWVPALLTFAREDWLRPLGVAALALWLWVALQLSGNDLELASYAAALLGSLVVLIVAWRLRPPVSAFARVVAFLGEASLAIYVMHSIVIAVLRTVLQKAGMLDETTLIGLGSFFGLAIPAVLYWMSLEYSARSGWPLTRFAGFGTATQSHYLGTTPRVLPVPVVTLSPP